MLKLNMSELMPLITEVISSGASFRLYPHGQSMLPTIKEGEDSVELSRPVELKKYDIVLYRRECGKFVLHRIVKICGDSFDMCGDNQLEIEKGISKSDIFAKVTAIHKDGESLDTDSKQFIKQAKKLYRRKSIKRLTERIKGFLYPTYKLIFKR